MTRKRIAGDSNIDATATPEPHRLPPIAPRWVKVLGFVALALVLLIMGLHLAGIGFGPHMHHGQ